jgi:flavin-dependent dehydrogenase
VKVPVASRGGSARTVSAAFDALVIGGGPAGSTTALLLARSGWRVGVVHRPTPDRARTGETLPGASRAPLQDLGLWQRFLDQCPAVSPGTVSWWADDQPQERDSAFELFGPAWHVDRQRFDRLLLDGARESGVEIIENARVSEASLDGDPRATSGWHLTLLRGGRVETCAARVLIVATGRALPPVTDGRLVRDRLDRLMAISWVPDVSVPWAGLDQRVWIEATAAGWWYSAPTPGGQATVTFFTDAGDAPAAAGRRALAEYWMQQLAHAPHTTERLDSFALATSAGSTAALSGALRVRAADSHRMLLIHGPHWLAVGDATATWDPLCGQGIDKALRSAWPAARAADDSLRATDGGASAMAAYAASQEELDRAYRRQYYAYYSQVRRWRDAAFWRRRQTVHVMGDRQTRAS